MKQFFIGHFPYELNFITALTYIVLFIPQNHSIRVDGHSHILIMRRNKSSELENLPSIV